MFKCPHNEQLFTAILKEKDQKISELSYLVILTRGLISNIQMEHEDSIPKVVYDKLDIIREGLLRYNSNALEHSWKE